MYNNPRSKIYANLVGPERITETLVDYIYRAEHLLTGDTEEIYISTTKHYVDSLVDTSEKMEKLASTNDRVSFVVDKFNRNRNLEFLFHQNISRYRQFFYKVEVSLT